MKHNIMAVLALAKAICEWLVTYDAAGLRANSKLKVKDHLLEKIPQQGLVNKTDLGMLGGSTLRLTTPPQMLYLRWSINYCFATWESCFYPFNEMPMIALKIQNNRIHVKFQKENSAIILVTKKRRAVYTKREVYSESKTCHLNFCATSKLFKLSICVVWKHQHHCLLGIWNSEQVAKFYKGFLNPSHDCKAQEKQRPIAWHY